MNTGRFSRAHVTWLISSILICVYYCDCRITHTEIAFDCYARIYPPGDRKLHILLLIKQDISISSDATHILYTARAGWGFRGRIGRLWWLEGQTSKSISLHITSYRGVWYETNGSDYFLPGFITYPYATQLGMHVLKTPAAPPPATKRLPLPALPL